MRTFGVLALAQAGCLALGLWLETQFMQAAVSQQENSHARISSAMESETVLKVIAFAWIAAPQMLLTYLFLSHSQKTSSQKEHRATEALSQHQNDLVRTRDAVIFGLAKLAESRDPETGDHLDRIVLYSTLLAKALRRHARYRQEVTSSFVRLIGISSALHDIGKVGVQDSVLLKPGNLTAEERRVMETHAEIGGQCLRDIERRLGGSNFLQMARQIALAHHERWDATGYPEGLAGESIPLAARIVAIADVYDALTTRRVYKDACSHERTVEIIAEGAGSHFDPDLVEVFLEIQGKFREIAERCERDAESDRDRAGEVLGGDVSEDKRALFPRLGIVQPPLDSPSASA